VCVCVCVCVYVCVETITRNSQFFAKLIKMCLAPQQHAHQLHRNPQHYMKMLKQSEPSLNLSAHDRSQRKSLLNIFTVLGALRYVAAEVLQPLA
jgi:hypothetical protein